ncbi:L-tryptophan--pyruvate aminotransferase 1-like [Prosopis cineraria]|uniref:L-tryptophan--pyruvate aminotransferase 1-like n=1 Tax=Prosopis cineraria TaxID=364024 RepID=UPI00240EF52F|nr:L-tryptophan--pyruvate aminotransferase 1-like [Prosopis cineraria]
MLANLPAVPDLHNNGLPSSDTNASLPISSVVNLDRGDTVLLESYWRKMSDECTVVIKGWEFLSYASDLRSVCWFMTPELRHAIKRLHALVGNAETHDKHIVIGNGSTQLFQASLFALSSSSSSSLSPADIPMNVVAAAPYYSGYPVETDIVRSSLYRWSGDALKYDKNEAYIEIVTSPNNPDGSIRRPMVNNKCGGEGKLIHDLAYYWPHYTPITHKANHDLMLFTFSKCTGHSGSRIGWAIVKDIEIAKKMTTFIVMNSIGVSKESQTRAAKIMKVVCDSYENFRFGSKESVELFFEYSRRLLKERWEKLREVIKQSDDFILPKFQRAYCNFTNESSETYPAFAWLMCEKDQDCTSYLDKEMKVLARSGNRFGCDPRYARINMLTRGDDFDEFLKRLSDIKDLSCQM